MNVDEIDCRLIEQGSWVEQVEWLAEVDSTNRFLANETMTGRNLPVLVGANTQTAGRGRGSNSWWSAPGSLTFSIVFDPQQFAIPTSFLPRMSLSTGMAVRKTVARWLPESNVQVKWPNDVYVQGRKVAGLLIESHPASPSLLIVGIGLNVNNSLQSAPQQLQAKATSIVDMSGSEASRTDVLIQLLEDLEHEWNRIATASDFLEDYRNHCYLSGRNILVNDGVDEIGGLCEGVDAEGALLVRLPVGVQRIFAGTIEVIGE
ncbi:biotin--[acetyl-CoA-carboxylase] ligase [Thalassoglobus sp. JC818]|uniref:biotin--[acetyl-CoA-carboxylase] ligase n=1 Tax=Thalassoglobus sp. JC818 TaxID=3232136 RepID=UPI0034584563